MRSFLKPSATYECLPNSNQAWRHSISNVNDALARPSGAESEGVIDRRVIPASATESTWLMADGHELRRIDWPGARGNVGEPASRGSILFLPGRGDNYEKYLETLEEWHRAGWQVTAADWRGQAGSGRLGRDDVTDHIDDFLTWVDDLAHI